MSGKVLKQLGPARKRLTDRINEAENVIGNGEIDRLTLFGLGFLGTLYGWGGGRIPPPLVNLEYLSL